jgi:hypothetical protein
VSFGRVSVSFTITSAASGNIVNATSPAGSGTVDVLVTAAGGTSSPNVNDQFVYTPLINRITPDNGLVTGGTTVEIDGGGLAGTNSVTFGDIAGTIKTVKDDAISAVTPGRTAPGAVVVLVKTATGSAQTKFTYTSVIQAPRARRKSGS